VGKEVADQDESIAFLGSVSFWFVVSALKGLP
jgi:hypothetical protein